MKYHGTPLIVDAAQWTGDNLRAIQDLLAPASPLSGMLDQSLGIKITTSPIANYGIGDKLAFAAVGDWITVRVAEVERVIDIVKAADFAARFTPVPLDLAAARIPPAAPAVGPVLSDS